MDIDDNNFKLEELDTLVHSYCHVRQVMRRPAGQDEIGGNVLMCGAETQLAIDGHKVLDYLEHIVHSHGIGYSPILTSYIEIDIIFSN